MLKLYNDFCEGCGAPLVTRVCIFTVFKIVNSRRANYLLVHQIMSGPRPSAIYLVPQWHRARAVDTLLQSARRYFSFPQTC